MAKKETARARIAALENNPAHTTRTVEADEQTKNDDINDLTNHKLEGEIDSAWYKGPDGNWHHPDFE